MRNILRSGRTGGQADIWTDRAGNIRDGSWYGRQTDGRADGRTETRADKRQNRPADGRMDV